MNIKILFAKIVWANGMIQAVKYPILAGKTTWFFHTFCPAFIVKCPDAS
jgi:hypothetical protein